jgi:hypothetical protein
MSRRLKQAGALALAGALVVGAAMGPVAAPAAADGSQHRSDGRSHHRGATVRFATFNASLNRLTEGQLVRDLSTPADQQAATVAEIVQRVRPDVLLLNEFDFAPATRRCGCSRTTTCRCRTAMPRAARRCRSATATVSPRRSTPALPRAST